MKTNFKTYTTQIKRNCKDNGESIEEQIRRLTANKSPIPQDVPMIYTEYKRGIIPDYDIRADRFDVAMEAQDKFAASEIAKGAAKGDLADMKGIEENEQEQETEQNN